MNGVLPGPSSRRRHRHRAGQRTIHRVFHRRAAKEPPGGASMPRVAPRMGHRPLGHSTTTSSASGKLVRRRGAQRRCHPLPSPAAMGSRRCCSSDGAAGYVRGGRESKKRKEEGEPPGLAPAVIFSNGADGRRGPLGRRNGKRRNGLGLREWTPRCRF
jgi:hypothetical protein